MKRTRRIAFLLVTVLAMSLMSVSAFAKSKYQVPAAGEYYTWDSEENKWDKTGTFTATYKSDGSITSYTWTQYQDPQFAPWPAAPDTKVTNYTWKKGFLTKKKYTYTRNYAGWETTPPYYISFTTTTSYKYKGGLPKKVTVTNQNINTDPASAYQNNTTTSVTNFSWKGKVGTGKYLSKYNGEKDYSVLEVTKKNQLKGSFNSNSSREYAKNGNIKKETTKFKGSQYKGTSTTKYNKYGYVSSCTATETYSMPTKVGTISRSAAIQYTMGAGKCPAEIVYTITSSGQTYDPAYPPTVPDTPNVEQFKVVITATKPVKKVMNCDKFGHTVWLGINESIGFGLYPEA